MNEPVKKVIEIVISILLHPIAMILMWIHVLRRHDLTGLQKTIWIVIGVLWGIGPILYIVFAGGDLW
jgi:hypothetical protein